MQPPSNARHAREPARVAPPAGPTQAPRGRLRGPAGRRWLLVGAALWTAALCITGCGRAPVQTVDLPRKDGSRLCVLVSFPRQGKRLAPVVVLLAGSGSQSAADLFLRVQKDLAARGYVVVCPEEAGVRPEGTDEAVFAREAEWKQRIQDVALLIKGFKKIGRCDAQRLVFVAAGSDRWVATYVASRLRKRVRGIVLLGAPPATLLEGFLGLPAESGRGAKGESDADRAARADALRKRAYGATAGSPFEGRTATYWQGRLEHNLYRDLLQSPLPTLVISGGRDDGERGRVVALRRFVAIQGVGHVAFETPELLDASWRASGGADGFSEVVALIGAFAWKVALPPLDLAP